MALVTQGSNNLNRANLGNANFKRLMPGKRLLDLEVRLCKIWLEKILAFR